MGWRKTLITLQAAARRAENEAQRQQRQQIRQEQREARLREEIEVAERKFEAAQEVNAYWQYITAITSLHKHAIPAYDWTAALSELAPIEPSRKSEHERIAQQYLDYFTPTLTDKVLGRVNKKRGDLLAELQRAKQRDQHIFNDLERT